MGQPSQGPFIQTKPDRFVRRCIRGMLPSKNTRGRDALSRVRCYVGVPENLNGTKAISIDKAHVKKLPYSRFITIGTLCKEVRER